MAVMKVMAEHSLDRPPPRALPPGRANVKAKKVCSQVMALLQEKLEKKQT